MGCSLYSYNKKYLKQDIFTKCKIEHSEKNEKILDFILDNFGSTINDKYIILNNEFWEEGNCYYNIFNVINKVFNVGNSFDCFLYNKSKEMLISYTEEYDVLKEIETNFGIEVKD